ncbi:MAG: hypothetical protein ACREU9_05350 [Gammaproteobacteria bacterium]
MLIHYKVTQTRTPRVVGLMPLPRVAQGVLSAPFRLAANATTRISRALGSWVLMWRFLAGLDTMDFYRDLEGRGDPFKNAQTKNAKS